MFVDIIDYCSNHKLLIVNFLNLEYFYLSEEVIIYDDTLFELSANIVTRPVGNLKEYGRIFS